jgi:hypothetical protein
VFDPTLSTLVAIVGSGADGMGVGVVIGNFSDLLQAEEWV